MSVRAKRFSIYSTASRGHATSAMTLDTYPGHLFPSVDHGDELAEAERRLLALVVTVVATHATRRSSAASFFR